MLKLVVNIGALPSAFGLSQIDLPCTLEDELRYSAWIGQEVVLVQSPPTGGTPRLVAIATLDRFVSDEGQQRAVLTELHYVDGEAVLPSALTKTTFALLEDTMLPTYRQQSTAISPASENVAGPFVGFEPLAEIAWQLRQRSGAICSFSGVRVNPGSGTATPLIPLDQGGELHIRNFIFLHDEPAGKFNQFAWTIGPDFEIVIDAKAAGTQIVSTVNDSGNLLIGTDQASWPDQAALAWHRQHFLDRLR